MRRLSLFLLLLSLSFPSLAQTHEDSLYAAFASRIFLPSFEVGYQQPVSDILSGSFTAKTAIEYRFRNNNDFFLRLSFDTYGARYRLEADNPTTNTLEGTVQFSDFMFGPGYRFGDSSFRIVLGVVGGTKLYEFPTASLNGNTITVSQARRSLFTTSVFAVLEYYFDEKSALTLTLDQNQVWQRVDFWADGVSAYGFSLGFITALL